jgi:hypothetical protein
MRKIILVIGLAFGIALLGCDKAKDLVSSDVSLVKNGTMEFDKSLSVGQAIDKYRYFKSTKWEAVKTDNGRRIVNVIGDLDISRYPYLNSDNTPTIKSAFIKFQFVINQDKTFEMKWCGLGAEKKDGTKTEPDESVNLLMCKNSMKEIYDNGPKEASAEEKTTIKSAAANKEGCEELMTCMKNGKTGIEAYFSDNQKYPVKASFFETDTGAKPPPYVKLSLVVDSNLTRDRDPEKDYVFNGTSSKCDKIYVTSSYSTSIDEATK